MSTSQLFIKNALAHHNPPFMQVDNIDAICRIRAAAVRYWNACIIEILTKRGKPLYSWTFNVRLYKQIEELIGEEFTEKLYDAVRDGEKIDIVPVSLERGEELEQLCNVEIDKEIKISMEEALEIISYKAIYRSDCTVFHYIHPSSIECTFMLNIVGVPRTYVQPKDAIMYFYNSKYRYNFQVMRYLYNIAAHNENRELFYELNYAEPIIANEIVTIDAFEHAPEYSKYLQ